MTEKTPTDDAASRRWRADPEAMVSHMGEEIVLMHRRHAEFFGLDGIGARFWDALSDGGASAAEFAEAVSDEYDVPPATLVGDILELIAQLAEHRLIAPAAGA